MVLVAASSQLEKKKKTEDDQISAEPQVCYQVFLVLE